MGQVRFDHVALLVRDLELSIKDYQEILKILDPENSIGIVRESGAEGGFAYKAATFVSENGNAVIQLLQSENPKDQERLQKLGECVHHLEFCSKNVDDTLAALKQAKVPTTSDRPVNSESMTWQKTVTVSPKKTHGVLVKVSSSYKVKNGKWIPEQ